MKPVLRHSTATLVLVTYVLAGVLLEVGHRDRHDVLLRSNPILLTHECGANEAHLPLDKRHDCLACVQTSQRLSTGVVQVVSGNTSFLCLAGVETFGEILSSVDFHYSGKRGPPLM